MKHILVVLIVVFVGFANVGPVSAGNPPPPSVQCCGFPGQPTCVPEPTDVPTTVVTTEVPTTVVTTEVPTTVVTTEVPTTVVTTEVPTTVVTTEVPTTVVTTEVPTTVVRPSRTPQNPPADDDGAALPETGGGDFWTVIIEIVGTFLLLAVLLWRVVSPDRNDD